MREQMSSALNTDATFKMLGLIWQSLISSVLLQVPNFVERKKKQKKEGAGSSMGEHVTLKSIIFFS